MSRNVISKYVVLLQTRNDKRKSDVSSHLVYTH